MSAVPEKPGTSRNQLVPDSSGTSQGGAKLGLEYRDVGKGLITDLFDVGDPSLGILRKVRGKELNHGIKAGPNGILRCKVPSPSGR